MQNRREKSEMMSLSRKGGDGSGAEKQLASVKSREVILTLRQEGKVQEHRHKLLRLYVIVGGC